MYLPCRLLNDVQQHAENGLSVMQMMSQQLTQRMQDPAYREKMAVLREDPELKMVSSPTILYQYIIF